MTIANDIASPVSPGSTRRMRSCSTASQASTQKSKGQRKSSSLPPDTVEYLKAWMMSPEHIAHPYPTEQEKAQIMADTGIELKQLTNWFVNNRKRYWKPRVEARLQQQAQAQAQAAVAAVAALPQVISPPTTRTVSEIHAGSSFLGLDMTTTRSRRVSSSQTSQGDGHPHNDHNNNNKTSSQQQPISALSSQTLAPLMASGMSRTVSEASSSASESGTLSDSIDGEEDYSESSDELDEETGYVTRTETINVHILRPTSEKASPSLEDVTILPNVPASRIARSFPNVMMSYQFAKNASDDRKKVQSRRDAEVVRVKKHYLKLYASEGPSDTEPREDPPSRLQRSIALRKRKELCRNDDDSGDDKPVEQRRAKYARRNVPTMWVDACSTAHDVYDDGLPSLEEAAYLFGFAP